MKKKDRKAIQKKEKKIIKILKNMSTKIQSSEDKKSQEGVNKQNGKSHAAEKGEQTLHTLLEKGMKDIYSAEKQLVDALPEVAQAVDNEELEDAINTHLEQTKKHVMRLEKAFERLGISKDQMEECLAMKGLIEETRKIIEEFPRSAVRDSALIIGSQKIEHYEIASYGSLCELCDVLGEDRIGDLLGKTLEEEEETDELLSEIAQDVNDEAAEMSMHEEEYQ
jgi:ferritin-like metal-binding protein YciE